MIDHADHERYKLVQEQVGTTFDMWADILDTHTNSYLDDGRHPREHFDIFSFPTQEMEAFFRSLNGDFILYEREINQFLA